MTLLRAALSCLALQLGVPSSEAKPILSEPFLSTSAQPKSLPAKAEPAKRGPTKPAFDLMVTHVQVFHQKTSMMGDTELYLSEAGARFIGRNGDIIICACPPTWDVLLYSKSKKQAHKITNKQAGKQNFGLFTVPVEIGRAEKTTETDAILKCRCLRLYVDGKKQPNSTNDPFIFQQRKHRVMKDVVFRIADIGPIKTEIQNFLYWIYNEHAFPGLPVEATTHYTDGSAVYQFRTMSKGVTSKPASFFAYPTDYKLSPNKMEVLLSDDTQTTLEELWGDKK